MAKPQILQLKQDILQNKNELKKLNGEIENSTTQRIVWDGVSLLEEGQEISVSITDQEHGVMLIFSKYSNGQAVNYDWNDYIVLKEEANIINGETRVLAMGDGYGINAVKYIRIYPNKIVGTDNNTSENSRNYVLRKIIGF